MCENPSPAQSNRPAPAAPSQDVAHAGFRAAQPQGAAAAPGQPGPTLTGWPRQLAWSDFRDIQSRPRGESEDARISMGFRPGRVRVVEEESEHRLGEMEFAMVLNPAGSWVVATSKTAELLAHEQGHFDIVGLCYRDLTVEARTIRGSSRNRLLLEMRRIMREHDQRAESLTREYETQTEHGRNQANQQAWQRQMATSRQSGLPLTAPPVAAE
ncbi:hypothetical protein [Candidatus Thiodiazotropha sp. CDECU1]|uniref:hypothetical protein n=1 Tax=Candidatus Thiodiazotropha sp. CDECU1 TaxID=3065865 RepID=UPI0029304C3F|nr:hypothetical protein [Candidatus Thiodiazotropha sp. CDECU1]